MRPKMAGESMISGNDFVEDVTKRVKKEIRWIRGKKVVAYCEDCTDSPCIYAQFKLFLLRCILHQFLHIIAVTKLTSKNLKLLTYT